MPQSVFTNNPEQTICTGTASPSVLQDKLAGTFTSVETALKNKLATRCKLIAAFVLLDLGTCFAVFGLIPHRTEFFCNDKFDYFIKVHRWEILLPIFTGVFLASIGAGLLVDLFLSKSSTAPSK